MSQLFDAKFNRILDSATVRIGLLAAGFGVWLAVGVGVLKLGM